ncbi:MAG: NADP-specific glutamate dehydrogenase [Clostridiales bacterium]|nr:NADP-specific glutamate dehydrogenase [Clostridiales bacterium]
MNAYMQRVLDEVKARNPSEPLFLQTVEEVFKSIEPVVEKHPEYEKYAVLERLCEPDRQVAFRVVWTDDEGKTHINRGFRVQFNGSIGPYKGGLRFAPNVTLDTMKFLAFEQTFKNSLTGMPIGSSKGGSDFDPRGKSDMEIMRFCQAFMTELWRYIGPDVDVPAGDIGVGSREIGYLYGQYKRIKAVWENGVITGKGLSYGGSLVRPEAAGYGAIYYLCEVLKRFGEDIKDKTVAVSGFGNVAWGVCKKVAQMGGKVVTISGPDGYCYDPDGVVTDEKISYLLKMRESGRDRAQDYADKFGCEFVPKSKVWGVKVDIAMPCAYQNEIGMAEAQQIVANGVKYYIEVANMPTTNEALNYLKEHCVVAPSKAVNAGGVAISALEMIQNSMRYNWTEEKVDNKLHQIMTSIYDVSVDAAEQAGFGYDLVAGGNIAGFLRVADAMIAQGIV